MNLGEIGRALDRIEAAVQQLDRKLDVQQVDVAELKVRVAAVEGERQTWLGAVAGGIVAGLIGLLQWLMQGRHG